MQEPGLSGHQWYGYIEQQCRMPPFLVIQKEGKGFLKGHSGPYHRIPDVLN